MSSQLTELSSPSSPFTASRDIRSIHRTLHLLYHHNKNQHRLTKWWKWLSMLKRWTLNLAFEIGKIENFEDVLDGNGNKDEHPFAAVWKIMSYLRDELVPRCYRAFSTVVADIQFSSLGVVLVATLAEVFKAVQINTDELSKLARVFESEKQPEAITSKSDASLTANEDFGEVIRREEVVSRSKERTKPAASTASEDRKKRKKSAMDKSTKRKVDDDTPVVTNLDKAESLKKEKKKKKKRKANAIDDIFAGL
ncbi:hypothetical protein FQN49_004538 [Arthroderma sp. PD_2]|nr:hypothetical protein FQN49_004538 [Arthroderma sp. PD_2]